ncbi:MAG: hypothetical protein ABJF88_06195 [Rhodothermales bacterium]
MLNGSRPYRLAAAVLVAALVLLLGAGGPTLLHLCGVGPLPATAQAPSEMPAMPPCHGGMPDGGEESSDEAPGGPTMQTCCLAVAAVPSDHTTVADPAQSLTPLVALLAPFVADVVAPTPAPAPRDTGPPPLSVRSHLALSVLLI